MPFSPAHLHLLTHRQVKRLTEWVMPSMAIFWPPEDGKLMVVFDEKDVQQSSRIEYLKQVDSAGLLRVC